MEQGVIDGVRQDATPEAQSWADEPAIHGAPGPECPRWCTAEHADGDLEAGDFLCTYATLNAMEMPGFEVGVQAAVTLEGGRLVYARPSVYMVGTWPSGMEPERAEMIAEAIMRATTLAEWTHIPVDLRVLPGGLS